VISANGAYQRRTGHTATATPEECCRPPKSQYAGAHRRNRHRAVRTEHNWYLKAVPNSAPPWARLEMRMRMHPYNDYPEILTSWEHKDPGPGRGPRGPARAGGAEGDEAKPGFQIILRHSRPGAALLSLGLSGLTVFLPDEAILAIIMD